jgi:hypothetical protein
MKKIIVTLAVLLLAAPAMASVDIVCSVTGANEVTVSFSTSGEAELVRAIALDVQVNDPNAWIEDVNCVSAGYKIYPGSIQIDAGGNVTDYGTCAGELDVNVMTSEQGSLYVGAANEPDEGALFILTLRGCTKDESGNVSVTVSENALRGGVVMEDPNLDPTVNLTGCTVNIGECPGCDCMADITDITGGGAPDGTVNFGDLMKIYVQMITVYPAGDPTFVFDIGLPAGFECADITDITGAGPPDGTINFGDLMAIYVQMITVYPAGDPTFVFDIGCPF